MKKITCRNSVASFIYFIHNNNTIFGEGLKVLKNKYCPTLKCRFMLTTKSYGFMAGRLCMSQTDAIGYLLGLDEMPKSAGPQTRTSWDVNSAGVCTISWFLE